jgi:hypothetical protein
VATLTLEAWGLQRLGRSARSTDPNTNLESSSRVGSSVVLANPVNNCVAGGRSRRDYVGEEGQLLVGRLEQAALPLAIAVLLRSAQYPDWNSASPEGAAKAQLAKRGAKRSRARPVNCDGSRPKRFGGLRPLANMAATVFGDHAQAGRRWAGACSQRSRLVDAWA